MINGIDTAAEIPTDSPDQYIQRWGDVDAARNTHLCMLSLGLDSRRWCHFVLGRP